MIEGIGQYLLNDFREFYRTCDSLTSERMEVGKDASGVHLFQIKLCFQLIKILDTEYFLPPL